ncbi:hypothetical protein ACIQLJ_13485 [Microbacterium sp. NPDC091313]
MNEITMPPTDGGVGASADALGLEVDAAAAGVNGVVSVYAARPMVARAVDHLAHGTAALSAVQLVSGRAEATVSIGVALGEDSARVAEAVAARVRSVLAARSAGIPTVRVRVSRLVAVIPPAPDA